MQRKTRICIDFDSVESAAEFVRQLKELDVIPLGVGAFKTTSLDRSPRAGGIGFKDTFLLKRDGDPDERLAVSRLEEV